MSLYTGTGDRGETGLFGNQRVAKDHVRIEAYGAIDELNSHLGVVRNQPIDPELTGCLQRIQEVLFEIGADLATPGGCASLPTLTAAIADAERWIDASEAELPPLRSFVLPAGSPVAAHMHVARTVCRRAERRFWAAARTAADIPQLIGVYLNRLSDLLFSWARRANLRSGIGDVPWRRAPPT